jgi:hypothetical protein
MPDSDSHLAVAHGYDSAADSTACKRQVLLIRQPFCLDGIDYDPARES